MILCCVFPKAGISCLWTLKCWQLILSLFLFVRLWEAVNAFRRDVSCHSPLKITSPYDFDIKIYPARFLPPSAYIPVKWKENSEERQTASIKQYILRGNHGQLLWRGKLMTSRTLVVFVPSLSSTLIIPSIDGMKRCNRKLGVLVEYIIVCGSEKNLAQFL
jgi:hypothetical protein